MKKTASERKKYYQLHKESIYASHRKYIEGHVNERSEYQRQYRLKNPEKFIYKNRKNLDRIRLYDREHYHRTRERHRELRISLAHGITVEEYRTLHQRSGGLCQICGKPEKAIHKRYGTPKVLAVDHDHKTGKVRGLLCQNCNNALGHLHEDISLLEKIKTYLQNASVT